MIVIMKDLVDGQQSIYANTVCSCLIDQPIRCHSALRRTF